MSYRHDLDGLPAFHLLLEDPFETLVAADVDRAHGAAHRENGWLLFLESLALRSTFMTDTEAAAELLRIEEARGVAWENTA